MPGRHASANAYRYAYQGSEKDNEITGFEGAHITTYYRGGDTRIGRWWSTDPVTYANEGTYNFMGNNPIIYNDIMGDVVKFRGKGARRAIKIARRGDKKFDNFIKELEANSTTFFLTATRDKNAKALSIENLKSDITGQSKGDVLKFDPRLAISVTQKQFLFSGTVSGKRKPFDFGKAQKKVNLDKNTPFGDELAGFSITGPKSENELISVDGRAAKPAINVPAGQGTITITGEVFPNKFDDMSVTQRDRYGVEGFEDHLRAFSVRYVVSALSVPVIVKVPIGIFGRPRWRAAERNYKLEPGEVMVNFTIKAGKLGNR